MVELYELTAAEAVEAVAEELRKEHPEIGKKLSRKLVSNALTYYVVIEDIIRQVEFLMEEEPEPAEEPKITLSGTYSTHGVVC